MTAMLRSTARFLHGKDFPGLGIAPDAAEPFAAVVNKLPVNARDAFYAWSGWSEAIPAAKLGRVSAERTARWMVSAYPKRRYPAVAIGSGSGALVHLWCALGIPWLPQTFLVPVRREGVHEDEPRDALEWGRAHADPLLDANPELTLHHMHDANQDRLMLAHMTYFRVKWLRLADAFKRFIVDTVQPGGTIIVSACTRKWPTTRVGERHVFQHGALGGATEEEFMHGSERVEAYLRRYDSHRRRWDAPEPDGSSPEAEWGFEEALMEDVVAFARANGYRVVRLSFGEPEHPSPFVADLYRWWYRERGLPANRLVVESFIVHEPWWTLRTGSVPFWMKFNMENDRDWVLNYLDRAEPFDEVNLMLFSHGVDAVGLPSIDAWRDVPRRARRTGRFLGVDENAFPRDFATAVRYHKAFRKEVPARYPMPGPLPLQTVERFLAEREDDYPVTWREHVDTEVETHGIATRTRHA